MIRLFPHRLSLLLEPPDCRNRALDGLVANAEIVVPLLLDRGIALLPLVVDPLEPEREIELVLRRAPRKEIQDFGAAILDELALSPWVSLCCSRSGEIAGARMMRETS